MPEAVENRFRELAAQYGLDYDAMCVKDNTNCQWWNTNVNAISFLEEKTSQKNKYNTIFYYAARYVFWNIYVTNIK